MTRPPLSQLALTAARWPPAAALAALMGVAAIFPERYGLLPRWASGPIWLMILALIVLSTFAHTSPLLRHMETLVTRALLVLVTALVVAGVIHLVALVLREESDLRGLPLLSTGATLWIGNLTVFALWYWALDRGGPEKRLRGADARADLQFPRANDGSAPAPGFLDYVFFSFNTSVAFSPTDTTPMTSRAKVLMMIQSLLSLITLAIVVARAVNIVK
jgi:uncharacterized membrane protein